MKKDVSVIIPICDDKTKLSAYIKSFVKSGYSVEMIVCSSDIAVPEAFSDISFAVADTVQNAVYAASGEFILFGDLNSAFAPDALARLIPHASCVCNIALVGGGLLFREYFSFDELAQRTVFCNYLLKRDVIVENELSIVGNSTLSIMNFIADYSRYCKIKTVHETLIYTRSLPEISADSEAIISLSAFAEVFSQTGNDIASMFFIRNIINYFGDCSHQQTFTVLKNSLIPFSENYALTAWIRDSFDIDVLLLAQTDDYALFGRNGKNLTYQEVQMPLLANDIVMDFYIGKQGIDTLKKCIGAWLYFKLYRRKDGVIKKIGCKLVKKLLGGDFNA